MRLLLNSLLFSLITASALLGSQVERDSGDVSQVEWGLYEMLTRRYSWEEKLDRVINELGTQPQLVLFFRDLNPRRGFPGQQVEISHARGVTPIISLEISEWGRGHDKGYLKEVANGDFDNFLKDWASEAKKCGLPMVLRFGFEMNGDWFPWGAQPKNFVIAWRRAFNIFKEVGCDNVQWMFSPNVLWDKRTAKKDLYNYYPGDAYVDLIGLDGYNFGDHHDKWHKWQSYEEVFERSIQACMKFNKPLYLSEVGCADGPRKAAWMDDFLNKVSQDDRVKGFIYFNHHNPRKKEPNWLLNSDEDTLNTFRSWARLNDRRKSEEN